MTKLKTPDRQPDFVEPNDAVPWKFWFEEGLYGLGGSSARRFFAGVSMLGREAIFAEFNGYRFHEDVQRAYRDWLVEKFLLGGKNE